jgi:hypothetical protein
LRTSIYRRRRPKYNLYDPIAHRQQRGAARRGQKRELLDGGE